MRKEYKQNTIEKVKKKNEELMALRKREMIEKNLKIDRHIEQKQKEFEADRQMRFHEAQIKQKHRDEVRVKVDTEFVDKISKVTDKLERISKKAQELYEKKEKERLINIELEAIRRREREEEAKRLTRQKEYERIKAAEEKEQEQLKASYLLSKREEIRELRKTVKLHSQLYKEKIKQEIQTLKRFKKLNPNNITIDPDPGVPDRVMITHTSRKKEFALFLSDKSNNP